MMLACEVKKTCPVCERPGIGSLFSEKAAVFAGKKSSSGTKAMNDFLMPLVHTNGFVPGSSDVGDVGWQTPTAQIHVSAFISGPFTHLNILQTLVSMFRSNLIPGKESDPSAKTQPHQNFHPRFHVSFSSLRIRFPIFLSFDEKKNEALPQQSPSGIQL